MSGASYGTFIKTPAPHVVEVLALGGFDFGIIDAEHAALDRGVIDTLLLAGRAARLPLLVRVSSVGAEQIQTALDAGAAGIVAPHIDTIEQARALLVAARYRGGKRGYSSSTRAASYGGMTMNEALDQGDGALVICQIETPDAVEAAPAIAALQGVGGLFVGRADLAVAMGESGTNTNRVLAAAERVSKAARAAGKRAGMAVGDGSECDAFGRMGADWFVIGADQSLLRRAAQQTLAAARKEGSAA